MLSPSSPVYVPPTASPRLISFLTRFARNSTAGRWKTAMEALVPINRQALNGFDALAKAGCRGRDVRGEVLPGRLPDRGRADRAARGDRAHPRGFYQGIEFEAISGDDAREIEPSLSDEIGAAIRLHGQRFINPGEYVHMLADSVRARGGNIVTGVVVKDIVDEIRGVRIVTADGESTPYDAVVMATGAWLGDLARQFGVRTVVQAYRGYSFSVPIAHVPAGPVYFPAQRIACTPLGDRLRVAGMMEFRKPDAKLDPRRIDAIVEAARPLLRDADLDARTFEWVGPRPCTPDGLPLIGTTSSPRVFAMRRPRHVGYHPRPDHRSTPRGDDHHRPGPGRAGPVQPSPLTYLPPRAEPFPARRTTPGATLSGFRERLLALACGPPLGDHRPNLLTDEGRG